MPINFLDRQFGRLGNSLFQYAALYKYAKMNNSDFYFQDPKWFEGCDDEIRQLFSEGIGQDDRVAIHVRRGDYVGNPFYVDLTETFYYSEAVNLFPGERFLVFSDDIEYCKQMFHDSICDFSEGKTEEEDLRLMASCSGIIMANSSFSWWAAYLGDPKKKVIYPKEWYTDGVQRTVCPPEWIAL